MSEGKIRTLKVKRVKDAASLGQITDEELLADEWPPPRQIR